MEYFNGNAAREISRLTGWGAQVWSRCCWVVPGNSAGHAEGRTEGLIEGRTEEAARNLLTVLRVRLLLKFRTLSFPLSREFVAAFRDSEAAPGSQGQRRTRFDTV
jgi:hypothetical protein